MKGIHNKGMNRRALMSRAAYAAVSQKSCYIHQGMSERRDSRSTERSVVLDAGWVWP